MANQSTTKSLKNQSKKNNQAQQQGSALDYFTLRGGEMQLFSDLGVNSEDAPRIVPRREFNPHAPLRPNVLHVYGVDFLSNKEVLGLFDEFKPTEVEWLDDSSCNVVFEDEKTRAQVQQQMGLPELNLDPEEVWVSTKPVTVKSNTPCQQKGRGKGRQTLQRAIRLELRIATEADRKDPGHSGHTDSVYYAQVKEQQALQRQATELRQMKKRQRMSRLPGRQESSEARTPQGTGGAASSFGSPQAPSPWGQLTGVPKIGLRGMLDPLAYLRARGTTGPSSPVADAASGLPASDQSTSPRIRSEAECKTDDLQAALRRAEAEYAAVLPTGPTGAGYRGRQRGIEGKGAGKGKGKVTQGRESTPGRFRGRTPGGEPTRERTPGRGAGQEPAFGSRGQKRRPVDQEPRPVTEAQPQAKRPEALPQVEAFLKEHRVKCRRYALNKTFRTVMFVLNKQAKAPRSANDESMMEESKEDTSPGTPTTMATGRDAEKSTQEIQRLPPWDQYLHYNGVFAKQGQFLHTVAWQADDRRILAVVPHPKRVDVEKLAKAVQRPVSAIKQRRLKEISSETNFPVFVCPPIGHPKDEQGRLPLLLVDSSILELKKPILFDCGSVGLCLPASEFLRSTGAACVDGLAKDDPSRPLAQLSFPLLPPPMGRTESDIDSVVH